MTRQKFLLTRQYSRSKELTTLIENSGHEVDFLNLFEVQAKSVTKNYDEFDAIIITSASAIDYLQQLELDLATKIYCVGNISAKKLRKIGFNNILLPTANNAKSLKQLIINNHSPQENILYLHGPNITLDFALELQSYDLKIIKQLAYDIKVLQKLPQNMSFDNLDYILIFSCNSAKIFLNLVKEQQQIRHKLAQSKILCLSDKIIAEFKNSEFKNVALFNEVDFLKKYYSS